MASQGSGAPDVVVVGGGVIGLSIAWRCRGRGLKAAVVDESPGRGASWAAAGMLPPATEAHYGEEATLALNIESNRRYPGFVAELEAASGKSVGFNPCGTVVVARDRDENAALDELYRFQVSLGLDVTRLRANECRALEPGLSPRIRGGILAEGDHQVDNRALVGALLEACKRAGVELVADRVESVMVDGDAARGVTLRSGGSLASPVVVLAAGCWTGRIGGIPPQAVLPVRPVKGQLLHLRGHPDRPVARHNVRGGEVYIVQRGDGRVVVGATVEEQGFDTTITAGAVHVLLRDAYEVLPGITELELVEVAAGLRPGSPDNAPLIGATSVEGLMAATGHYRFGILLTPVTCDSIVELIETGRAPDVIAPFSPQRFYETAGAAS